MDPESYPNSHGNDILDGLPSTTKMLQYQGRQNFLDTVFREVDNLASECNGDRSHYMVFSNINETTLLSDLFALPETDPIHHYFQDYCAERRLLVVKIMPSVSHETLWQDLYDAIRDDLNSMGAGLEIAGTASSRFQLRSRQKEPDCGIRPRRFPREKVDSWPTLVMEAGYSESRAKVDADARAWLTESQGQVRICFAVAVNRKSKDISIRKWHAEELTTRNTPNATKAYLAQELKIAQGSNGSEPEITNLPLVIDFKRLLARDPTAGERDVIVGKDRLELMARTVWESRDL